jgi:hypothetical protein
VFSLAKSQKNFWNSKDAYLGQTRPENIPVTFAKGVLADTGIVFCRIAFSNNGKEIYYTFAKDWNDYTGSGTSSMFFDGKKWVKSKTLFPELAEPTFSIDEQSLYLRGKGSIIWKADRINNGWSKPHKYLDMPYGLYNLMPTLSGNFYVGSNGNVSDKNDYSSYKFSLFTISQKDTVVKSLGSPLNQPGFNGDLFIAPDESYIIISTNETPDYESELYISFRKKDKTWTQPVSLGAEINTGKAHRFGQYVTPDGKYLFYTWGTSSKDCATYWVRFDTLLKKLKPAEL